MATSLLAYPYRAFSRAPPALPCAAAAAAGFYALSPLVIGATWWAAAFFAGAAVTCAVFPGITRACAPRFLAVAAGLLVAAFGASAPDKSFPSFGFRPDIVRSVSGRLASEPRLLSSGTLLAEIDLDLSRSTGGASAAASGRISAFLGSGVRGVPQDSGEPLSLIGRVKDGERPVFEARRIAEAGSTAAFSGTAASVTLASIGNAARRAFSAAIGRACGKQGEASALGRALLIGDRGGLDPARYAQWRDAGCAHVVSLSGQHLAILAALVIFIVKPFLGPRVSRLAVGLGVAGFLVIAGTAAPLLRSALMVWIAISSSALDRPQTLGVSLSLAFLLMLASNPADARGIGFQLSFLAMAGLAFLAPRIEFTLLKYLPAPLARAFAASFAAQAATAPLGALVFGKIYPFGVIASLPVGFLAALFMYVVLAAVLVVAIAPGLLCVVSPCVEGAYRLLQGCVGFFAGLPAAGSVSVAWRIALGALVVLPAIILYALPNVEARRLLRSGTGKL